MQSINIVPGVQLSIESSFMPDVANVILSSKCSSPLRLTVELALSTET